MNTECLPKIPDRVTLRAIGYKVSLVEGMVLFASDPGVWGSYNRLAFVRKSGCWYVEITSNTGSAMTSHIAAAQELVDKWFGGNHVCPRGEHVP